MPAFSCGRKEGGTNGDAGKGFRQGKIKNDGVFSMLIISFSFSISSLLVGSISFFCLCTFSTSFCVVSSCNCRTVPCNESSLCCEAMSCADKVRSCDSSSRTRENISAWDCERRTYKRKRSWNKKTMEGSIGEKYRGKREVEAKNRYSWLKRKEGEEQRKYEEKESNDERSKKWAERRKKGGREGKKKTKQIDSPFLTFRCLTLHRSIYWPSRGFQFASLTPHDYEEQWPLKKPQRERGSEKRETPYSRTSCPALRPSHRSLSAQRKHFLFHFSRFSSFPVTFFWLVPFFVWLHFSSRVMFSSRKDAQSMFDSWSCRCKSERAALCSCLRPSSSSL